MNIIKKTKNKIKQLSSIKILGLIVFLVFIIYSVITIISQYSLAAQKNAELDLLKNELQILKIKNEEIQNILNYTDEENKEYIERIARHELDYVENGERVFVNISGE